MSRTRRRGAVGPTRATPILLVAMGLALAAAGAGCESGGDTPAEVLVLDPGDVATNELLDELRYLYWDAQASDTFVGTVEVVGVDIQTEEAVTEDASAPLEDSDYRSLFRWAIVDVEILERLAGSGSADVTAGERLRIVMRGVCPALLRADGAGGLLEGSPREAGRSWGVCDYLDRAAPHGPVAIELRGRFPVCFMRAVTGARGLAAIHLSPETTSAGVQGAMRLFMREKSDDRFDASFFLDEPGRHEVSLEDVVAGIEEHATAAGDASASP